MFDNFSFEPLARSPSLDSSNASSTGNTSPSISPCSTTTCAQYPFPQYTVADLAVSFANQRIRNESRIYYDPCEAYAAADDDAGWQLDPLPAQSSNYVSVSRPRTLPPRPHSPSRRTQRQANARLLCSLAHHQEIAQLVARMVESEDQCSVAPPKSLAIDSIAATAVEDEDEGYDSSDVMTTPSQSRQPSLTASRCKLDYYRSSEFRPAGACVSKAVRLRKTTKHRRVRSSEDDL